MALKPLTVKIGADTSGLEKGMAAAGKRVAVFSAAAVAGLAAVGGGLVLLTKQGLTFADSQAKAARSIDGTIDGLRALQIAGGDAGLEVGGMTRELQTMTRELAKVADGAGGPAADALDKLGLSADALGKMDVDQRLAAISDSARRLGMSAGQTSALLQSLGIRNRDFANVIMQGGDAIRAARQEVEDFGLSLDQDAVAKIEMANDAMSRFSFVAESLRNQLAVNVAPALLNAAQRFQDMAKAGGPLQEAVQRIAAAFGNLVETLLQDSVVDGFATALVGIANVTGTLAESLVWVTQNIEIFTAAVVIATIATIALGGPITIIIRLAALAAAGLMALRGRAEEYESAAYDAERAQQELNAALGTFHQTGAPEAASQAMNLAQQMLAEAEAAYEAAAGHRERNRAMLESMTFPGVDTASNPAAAQAEREIATATADMENAATRMEEARARIRRIASEIGSRDPMAPSDTVAPAGGGVDPERTDPLTRSLGGGSAVTDLFEARLEALMAGLETERETLEAWRSQGMADLDRAHRDGLLSEQEYLEARKRLEEQYAAQSNAIEAARQANNKNAYVEGFGAILSAAGEGNKKMMKASKTFNAGMAFIDTMAGAARELRKGTFGFATAAAVIAKGLGFVNAIRSANDGGGGLSAPSGGGAAAAPAQAAETPTTTFRFTLQNDPMGFGESFARQMIEQLNEANRNGGQIRGVLG